MNRSHQCRLSAKLRVKEQPDGKRQFGVNQFERLAFAQQFTELCKRIERDRFVMLLDHLQDLSELDPLSRFERLERDAFPRLIDNAQRPVIRPDQPDRPLDNVLRDLFEIRVRVQRIGDLEQSVGPPALLFLGDVEACVLVTDGELAGDRLKKSDLLIEPLARLMRIVQPQQAQARCR